MPTQRQLFLQHLAQTSDFPLGLEIERAEGIYMYDTAGKRYADLISGIGVSNVGHRHPKVVAAIKQQVDQYMHLMVYGEYIQSPQVRLARMLVDLMPAGLDNVYLTNSGTEAVEGALKLAKRYTGRPGLVTFRDTYHGSTHGALSVMGNEHFKNAFRPLLPDVQILPYNVSAELQRISQRTAAVIVESVQGEAGYQTPCAAWMQALRARCTEVGALLIVDEIQTGMGRTGKMFGFEHYGIIPDMVTLAKGLGGGLPIGAFIAPSHIMGSFKTKPLLGHITTFGGNPVCAAAACAVIEVLHSENVIAQVPSKHDLMLQKLKHPAILRVSGKGLMLAVDLGSFDFNKRVIDRCLSLGVITDWFLFNDRCLRLAPPLTISHEQLNQSLDLILQAIDHAFRTDEVHKGLKPG
ncbi:MAG: aspartate aminotransferase family protein [Bacteroidia bacterium]